jgi:hypothetical protein
VLKNDNEAAIAALAGDRLVSRRALNKWQEGLAPDFGKPVLTRHDLCDKCCKVASPSLLENWIDEAERRTWFLFEATRAGEAG